MAKLFAGTSGFAYPQWKPAFYPKDVPQKKFLEYYARRLNSVEINYTFRRLPAASTLTKWIGAGAPVATPLAWHEVAPDLVPTRFLLRNALDRFAQLGDLFRPVLETLQRPEPALERLEAVMRQKGPSASG